MCKEYNKVNLIPNTDEKYISYTVNTGCGYEFDENDKPRKYIKLSIVDSFRFMSSSIEKLAKGIKKEDCKHIKDFMKNSKILNKLIEIKDNEEDEICNILTGKGVFPYELMNNFIIWIMIIYWKERIFIVL